jgi:nucleoside-diphosphate-sugar epimerase
LHSQPLTVYGNGSQTRSFCYVSDLVEGLVRLLHSDEPEPVNIGNPVEMTILQFAEATNRLTGNAAGIVRQPLPVDDPKQRRPNISKARRVLYGWEPAVPLEQGLAATVADFRRRLGVV